jgi:hypothetical protein
MLRLLHVLRLREYETAKVCPNDPKRAHNAPQNPRVNRMDIITLLRLYASTISSANSLTPSTLREDLLSSPLTLTILLSLNNQRLTLLPSSVSDLASLFISTEPLRHSSRSSSILLSTELPSLPSSTLSTFVTSITLPLPCL